MNALDPEREGGLKLSGAFVNYEQFMLDPLYTLVEINETLSRLDVGTHGETPEHYRKHHSSKNGEAIDEAVMQQKWTKLKDFWLPNFGEHTSTTYTIALHRLKVYLAGVQKGLFLSSNVTKLAQKTQEQLTSFFMNVWSLSLFEFWLLAIFLNHHAELLYGNILHVRFHFTEFLPTRKHFR